MHQETFETDRHHRKEVKFSFHRREVSRENGSFLTELSSSSLCN